MMYSATESWASLDSTFRMEIEFKAGNYGYHSLAMIMSDFGYYIL